MLIGHEKSIEWLGSQVVDLFQGSTSISVYKNNPTVLDIAGASGVGKTTFGQYSLDSICKYVQEHQSDLPGKLRALEQQLKQQMSSLSRAQREDLERDIEGVRTKIANKPMGKNLERIAAIAAMPKTRVMLDFNGSKFLDSPIPGEDLGNFIARRILARHFGTSFEEFYARSPSLRTVDLTSVLDVIATKLRHDHNMPTTGDNLPWVMIVAHIDELQLLTGKGQILDSTVNTNPIQNVLNPLRNFVVLKQRRRTFSLFPSSQAQCRL